MDTPVFGISQNMSTQLQWYPNSWVVWSCWAPETVPKTPKFQAQSGLMTTKVTSRSPGKTLASCRQHVSNEMHRENRGALWKQWRRWHKCHLAVCALHMSRRLNDEAALPTTILWCLGRDSSRWFFCDNHRKSFLPKFGVFCSNF